MRDGESVSLGRPWQRAQLCGGCVDMSSWQEAQGPPSFIAHHVVVFLEVHADAVLLLRAVAVVADAAVAAGQLVVDPVGEPDRLVVVRPGAGDRAAEHVEVLVGLGPLRVGRGHLGADRRLRLDALDLLDGRHRRLLRLRVDQVVEHDERQQEADRRCRESPTSRTGSRSARAPRAAGRAGPRWRARSPGGSGRRSRRGGSRTGCSRRWRPSSRSRRSTGSRP